MMSEDSTDADYICSLTAESLQKAADELYEDPKERLSAVKTLRKWALEQPWLKTPTDTVFLLSFLRGRKFSQLSAREVLTKYWTIRTECPKWFHDLDCGNPNMLELWETGFLLHLPEKDKMGRQIIWLKTAALDGGEGKKKWDVDLVYRALQCSLGWALMDENVQVSGLVLFLDSTHATETLGRFFRPSDLNRFMQSLQDAVPVRIKALHYYNLNPFFQAVLTMIKTFMKEKIKNRMHIHGNSLVPVYEHIEKRHLPREYLPDDYIGPCAGSIKDIIAYNIKELSRPDVRAYVKKVNSADYGVDLKLKPTVDDMPNESFRQLNTD